MSVLPLYVCSLCWVLQEVRGVHQILWNYRVDVTGGCELPCRCWQLNLGLPEEQLVLLPAEPSLLANLTLK